MFVLTKKLKILKGNLRAWNHSSFGNVHDKVKQAESVLSNIQEKIFMYGHTDVLASHKREAHTSLYHALNIEEMF